jgi:hypothetical protein
MVRDIELSLEQQIRLRAAIDRRLSLEGKFDSAQDRFINSLLVQSRDGNDFDNAMSIAEGMIAAAEAQ